MVRTRRVTLGTLVLLLAGAAWTFASAPVGRSSLEWVDVSSNAGGVTARLNVPSFQVLSDDLGEYISFTGSVPTGTPLPRVTAMVAAPNGLGVVAQISATQFVSTGVYAPELAGTMEHVDVGDPVLFRQIRLFPVVLTPVRVAGDGEILLANDLQLNVEFAGQDTRSAGTTGAIPVSAELERFIDSMILNLDEVNLNVVAPVGRILVVVENNPTIMNNVNPYVQWKRQQGYKVDVGNPTSTTSYTAIMSLITSYYNNGDAIPLEYVILIGDADGAVDMAAYNSLTDHYYSQLSGGDILADVAIGRYSVQDGSTELVRVVNKTLAYERDVYMDNTSWFTQACLQAGSSSSGLSTILTNRVVRDMLAPYGIQSDTLWYTMGGSFPQHIITNLNEGSLFLNYRGYLGMSGWDNSYLTSLNNGSKLPIVTTITCGTGDFATTANELTEGFLRSGTGGNNYSGGVAAIGTATTSTHTRFNNIVDGGIYEAFTLRGMRSLGWALVLGKLRLYEAYTGTGDAGYIEGFSQWNNLMGDPALRTWLGIPQIPSVNHVASISYGRNFVDVEVSNLNPWPDMVWATLANTTQVLATKRIDSSGHVRLMFEPTQAGSTMKLTVCGDNVVPYQADIPINTVANYVYVSATGVNDGVGDDDFANPGETVALNLTMRNGGSSAVGAQAAVVTTTSPYLSIVGGNTFNVPALGAGASTLVSNAVQVAVAANTPDSELPELTVTVGGNQVSDTRLLIHGFVVTGGIQGPAFGGDGQLDPGETTTLTVPWTNRGTISAIGVVGTLSTTSANITINDGVATYPTVAVNGTGTNTLDPFSITATNDAWPGMRIDLLLVVTDDDNGRDSTRYRIYVGDPAGNGLTGPDDYGYWALDSGDDGFGVSAAYNWTDVAQPGNNLGISDTASDDDDGVVVNLPFPFGYYGQVYSQITVCSNGFFTFGANNHYFFRNWPIPSPLGAPSMVAVNWDDLITTGGGIYGYHDAGTGRYIIQWNTQTRNNGASQVFQAILYDPAIWPTLTGNGLIGFQYQSFSQQLSVSSDNDYCTVGIESPDEGDGIQYNYWLIYAQHAAAIVNGSALLFTDDLSGGGGLEPQAEISTTEINVAYQGDPIIETVDIANNGEGALLWSLTEVGNEFLGMLRRLALGLPEEPVLSPPQPEVLDAAAYEAHKKAEARIREDMGAPGGQGGGPVIDASGGPDAFGYVWEDSNEPGGPAFSWHSQYGTAFTSGDIVDGTFDDGYFGARALGFSFNYYGVNYSTVYVNTNGFLTFASGQTGTSTYSNRTLPSVDAPHSAAPASMIAPFWDDLNPTDGGTIYFYTNNSNLAVVTYYNVPGWGGAGLYRFQMLLHGNGTITFQYQSMGVEDITGATIGIQNDAGSIGLTVVNNAAYVEDNLAILFSQPTVWFEALDRTGLLLQGQSTNARVQFDGEGLADGIYEGSVIVNTNDQNNPSTEIPVTMYIGAQYQAPQVSDIPDQFIQPGGSFAAVNLDSYVTDPNFPDNQLTWQATGQVELNVSIINRVATISPPNPQWEGSETITFTATNPNNLSDGDDATFSVGTGNIEIPVAGGRMELVSFPVTLPSLAVEDVFAGVTNLVAVQDDHGGLYQPGQGINTIGDIVQTEGYRFYTPTAQTFSFAGPDINPMTQYSVSGGQWNWVGTPYTSPVPVDMALLEIQNELNIVLNDDGDIYWPDLNLNTIGDMTPGDGYYMHVSSPATFNYNFPVGLQVPKHGQPQITELRTGPNAPVPTGRPYPVQIVLNEDLIGRNIGEIQVLDGSVVVGSGYLLPDGRKAVIVAWQANAAQKLAGFNPGAKVDTRLLDESGAVIRTRAVGETAKFGEGSHATVTVRSAEIPDEFEVSAGYPNPFNPTLTVPYALPRAGEVSFAVFNVLGRRVYAETLHQDAGRHQFVFSSDHGASSGVYFLQVQFEQEISRQKMVLLK